MNDRSGAEQGDSILKECGAVITAMVGESGFPIRFAGDVFVVLLPESPEEPTLQWADAIVDRIRRTDFTNLKGSRPQHITVSVGVAQYPDQVVDADFLLTCADQACYVAKRLGRNQAAAYRSSDPPVLETITLQYFFPCSRTVGREGLVATLADGAFHAGDHPPPWPLVVGPAGVGRSRILEEIRSHPDGEERVIFSAAGEWYRSSQPFGFIVDALDGYARVHPDCYASLHGALEGAELAAASRLVPALADAGIQAAPAGEHAEDYDVLIDGFCKLLVTLGGGHAPLLLLDDMHFADRGTLKVLERLRRYDPRAFAGLAYINDDSVMAGNGELKSLVEGMLERGEAVLMPLEPLTDAQVQEMIEATLPGDLETVPTLAPMIVARSQGLPLMVEEQLKFLIHRRWINLTRDGLVLSQFTADELPNDIAGLMKTRIQYVDADVREMLTRACIFGPTFQFNTLVALEEKDEGHLRYSVEKAIKMHLLAETWHGDDSWLRFNSSAMRNALYESKEEEWRRAQHLRVAQMLEKRYGERLDAILAELVYHLDSGREPDRAQTYETELSERYRGYGTTIATIDEGGVVPEEILSAAIDQLRELKITLQNIRMYGAMHTKKKGGYDDLHLGFRAIFMRLPAVTYSEVESRLLINGNTLPATLAHGSGVVDQLQYFGLKAITFSRGVTTNELRALTEIMCLTIEDIKARGGFTRLLEDQGVKNITINEKVFIALGEKDILLKDQVTGQQVLLKQMEAETVEVGPRASDLATIFKARDPERGDLPALQESLEQVGNLVAALPVLDVDLEGHLANLDAAEIKRLRAAQAEVLEWYRELNRYVDMGYLKGLETDFEVLASNLESGDGVKIAAAARVFYDRGAEAASFLLRFILRTKDVRARRAAVALIAKIKADEDIYELLLSDLRLAQLPDDKIRLLSAMVDLKDVRLWDDIRVYAQHPVRELRRAVLRLLALQGSGSLPSALAEALESDRDEVRLDAIRLICYHKVDMAVPQLINLVRPQTKLARDVNDVVQAAACQALGVVKDFRGVEVLAEVLTPRKGFFKAKDTHIREAAAYGLANLAVILPEHRESCVEVLQRIADDRDPMVRTAVREGLRRLGAEMLTEPFSAEEVAEVTAAPPEEAVELRGEDYDPDALVAGLKLGEPGG